MGYSSFSLPPCAAGGAVVRAASHLPLLSRLSHSVDHASLKVTGNFSRPSNLLWTLGPKDSFCFPLPCPAPYTRLNYNLWVSTVAKTVITDSFQEYSLIEITKSTGLALLASYSPSSSHLVNYKTLEGRLTCLIQQYQGAFLNFLTGLHSVRKQKDHISWKKIFYKYWMSR